MKTPDRTVEYLPLRDLVDDPRNPKDHDINTIDASLNRFGVLDLIVRDERTGRIVSGHGRKHTLEGMEARGEEPPQGVTVDDEGQWLVPVVTGWASDSDLEAAAALIALNRTTELGGWNDDALLDLLDELAAADDIAGIGFDTADLDALRDDLDDLDPADLTDLDRHDPALDDDDPVDPAAVQEATRTLADRFGVPPVTVLDTISGHWINRRRAWTTLGIASYEGREESLLYQSGSQLYNNWYAIKNIADEAAGRSLSEEEILADYADQLVRYNQGKGTSTFDPVLAEIIYEWFSAPGDLVIDPWAGGSVRGIVAAMTGRTYHGVELRQEQVDRNEAQWQDRPDTGGAGAHDLVEPVWITGASPEKLYDLDRGAYQLAIGCPPYYDLEEYSDDDRDLSNMTHDEFDDAMNETIRATADLLADDSFAVFVVANVRDKRGDLIDMRQTMNTAARGAGLKLANSVILRNNVGTAAIRAARGFIGGRSLAPVHQEVIVYVKGDRRAAAKRLGEPSMMQVDAEGDIETDDDE